MAKAAKKKPAAKKTSGEKVNKSEEIRKYKLANPELGPTAISRALAEQGIKVPASQVSTVVNKMNGGPKKKRKKKATSAAKPAAKATTNDKLSFAGLLEARKFVVQVGGADAAKQLVDAVSKLRG